MSSLSFDCLDRNGRHTGRAHNATLEIDGDLALVLHSPAAFPLAFGPDPNGDGEYVEFADPAELDGENAVPHDGRTDMAGNAHWRSVRLGADHAATVLNALSRQGVTCEDGWERLVERYEAAALCGDDLAVAPPDPTYRCPSTLALFQ